MGLYVFGRAIHNKTRAEIFVPHRVQMIGRKMNQLELTYRGAVYPWHCDHMGHMNVMWYTGKFDEASWSLLAQIGLTRAYFQEREHGMAALQQNITYKCELKAGDIVSIRSGVLDVQEKIVRILHEMQNEETLRDRRFRNDHRRIYGYKGAQIA